MANEFFGRGKLLLSGEYLVLDGAQALALGLNVGQRLSVENISGDFLQWESLEKDGSLWFSGRFDAAGGILESSDAKVAGLLSSILKVCIRHNSGFSPAGKKVVIRAGFDRSWGVGSSSTLIYTLGRWAGVDPFVLVREVLPGSGYDVACAGIGRGNAIVYALKDGAPSWEEIEYRPPFADALFFVYSGVKQDTRKAVERYRAIPADVRRKTAEQATQMTREMRACTELEKFEELIVRHETLVGDLLDIQPVRERLFSDYRGGVVKSLGAWGGDFFLATGKDAPEYLRHKGFEVILPFNSIAAK